MNLNRNSITAHLCHTELRVSKNHVITENDYKCENEFNQ